MLQKDYTDYLSGPPVQPYQDMQISYCIYTWGSIYFDL